MIVIKPSIELLDDVTEKEILKRIELVGRTAYKSEDKITEDSCIQFYKQILKRKHLAVIEFVDLTVKVICDRGVTHEIVRHRMASYLQESTRFCNYGQEKFGGEIQVINPTEHWNPTLEQLGKGALKNANVAKGQANDTWIKAMVYAEEMYMHLISLGVPPQLARGVLPNSLKTEINIKYNLREWLHFFNLRTAPDAHPQMREIACAIFDLFKQKFPLVFSIDDIYQKGF